MTTTGKVYFVGGASASGKSVATRQMAIESGLPRIELDGLYNALEQDCDEKTRQRVMKTSTRVYIQQLLDAGASMIVEGGWMWPDVAAELVQQSNGRLSAVFCGYPNATAADKLKAIRNYGQAPKHWLARKDKDWALSWIEKQISGSREYEDAAAKVNLHFFDFSDVSSGNAQLLNHFRVSL